jgi:hypothetical protein
MECVLEWFKRDKAPRAQLACAALMDTIEEHRQGHDLCAITFLLALWPRIATRPSQDKSEHKHNTNHTTHGTRHTTRQSQNFSRHE